MYEVSERSAPGNFSASERTARGGNHPANVVLAEAVFGGVQQMNPLFRLATGYAADPHATVHHGLNHDAA